MSDTSQGPGWWLASDGKWYPPEQAPGAQAPQAQPPVPPPLQPPPPKSSGGKGCIYALIAVAAVIVVGGIALVLALAFVIDGSVDDDFDEAFDEDSCSFLTNTDARDVLSGDPRVVELSGFNQLLTVAVDNRVLENAPDCVVLSTDDAALARVARYEGSDASSVFDDERDVADGTSQDQGGGISIETDSYLSEQAVDLGDEAFCTTAGFLGEAGVLVRRGDTLVYASIGLDLEEGETPDVDLDSGGFATDEEHCVQAQALAQKVLD